MALTAHLSGIGAETTPTPAIAKLHAELVEQITAHNAACDQLEAQRQNLDAQINAETFPPDLAERARQIGQKRIELLQRARTIRRDLASRWFPARAVHRVRVADQSHQAHVKSVKDLATKLAALGFDAADAEHFAGFHPTCIAIAAEAQTAQNRVGEVGDVSLNNEAVKKIVDELADLARRAMAAV